MKRSRSIAFFVLNVASFFLFTGTTRSAELFENRVFTKEMTRGDLVHPGDTVGGYPIFMGGERWSLLEGKANVMIGPSAIWMGNLTFANQTESGSFALQQINANLNRSFDSPGWHGGDCSSKSHLFMKYDISGNRESCLVIDPIVMYRGQDPQLHFRINATEMAGQGRILSNNFIISASVLGFREKDTNSWSELEANRDPDRKRLLVKLKEWGEQFMAATSRAFDQNPDAYVKMPSHLDLVPVPESLKGQALSPFFLGAIESLSRRKEHKAVAFSPISPGVTVWSAWFEEATPEDARSKALARCEELRKGRAEPCTLYAP